MISKTFMYIGIFIIMVGITVWYIFKDKKYHSMTLPLEIALGSALIIPCMLFLRGEYVPPWFMLLIIMLAIFMVKYKFIDQKRVYLLENIKINGANEEAIQKIIGEIKKYYHVEDHMIGFKVRQIKNRRYYGVSFAKCPNIIIRQTMGKINDYIKINGQINPLDIFLMLVVFVALILMVK